MALASPVYARLFEAEVCQPAGEAQKGEREKLREVTGTSDGDSESVVQWHPFSFFLRLPHQKLPSPERVPFFSRVTEQLR